MMNYSKAAKVFGDIARTSDSFRVSQLEFLFEIAATGSTGLGMTEHVKKKKVSTATMSKRVDNLIKGFNKPLIMVDIDQMDRRHKRLKLTDAGKALIHDMQEAFQDKK